MEFYTSLEGVSPDEMERLLTSRSLTSSTMDPLDSSCISQTSRSCAPSTESVRTTTRTCIRQRTLIEIESEISVLSDSVEAANSSRVNAETQSDIVPPLDLQSEDICPSTRDCTYSYRKDCHSSKLGHNPEVAYKTWLSAKRKVIADAEEQRREAERTRRQEEEERKRLAKEKYEAWLERKKHQQKQKQPQTPISQNRSVVLTPQVKHAEISEEQARAALEEWERSKRRALERRRAKQRQREEEERRLKEERRKAAKEAWASWAATAATKPKPVPLNRGILTLRGTVSDIFVNPNKWQPIVPGEDQDDD